MILAAPRSPRRTAVLSLLGWVCWAAAGLLAGEPPTYTHRLTSDRVDGEHRDLKADLAPIEMGPMTVTLTSPTHTLEILEHELRLGPAGGGTDRASLRARFRGQAHLVAELEVAGVGSELEDHIELPLQETEVAGLVEIERLEDGYRIRTLENPSHVEIRIESSLAGQLGLLCRGFAVLAMGNIDCDAIDQAMSVLRVPLPEPGEEFFIAAGDLTGPERAQIEEYLANRL